MAASTYMDGRFKYSRPQAVLWADNPGLTVNKWLATGLVANIQSGSTEVNLTSGTTLNVRPGDNVAVSAGTDPFAPGAKVATVVSATKFTVTIAHTSTRSGTPLQTGTFFYVPDGTEPDNFLILSDHNRSPLDFAPGRIEKRERMINGRMRSYHIADKIKISLSWSDLPSRAFAGPPSFNQTTGKSTVQMNTVDGGAGGNELLKWYEDHVGSFWVYLAYDKYTNFGDDKAAYGHLAQYNQVVEMYVADFSYSVEKRGGTNHDLWKISVTLEEA
jgi:hypothetical protein